MQSAALPLPAGHVAAGCCRARRDCPAAMPCKRAFSLLGGSHSAGWSAHLASLQVAVEYARALGPSGKSGPSVLALSRQGMPNLPGSSKEEAAKGGYIVHGGDGKPDIILMGSGAHPPRAAKTTLASAAQLGGKQVSWQLAAAQPSLQPAWRAPLHADCAAAGIIQSATEEPSPMGPCVVLVVKGSGRLER